MPIVYHEKSKEFHLYNEEISYDPGQWSAGSAVLREKTP